MQAHCKVPPVDVSKRKGKEVSEMLGDGGDA